MTSRSRGVFGVNGNFSLPAISPAKPSPCRHRSKTASDARAAFFADRGFYHNARRTISYAPAFRSFSNRDPRYQPCSQTRLQTILSDHSCSPPPGIGLDTAHDDGHCHSPSLHGSHCVQPEPWRVATLERRPASESALISWPPPSAQGRACFRAFHPFTLSPPLTYTHTREG